MNVLSELQSRFRTALTPLVDDPTPYLELIRPAQDARFGDYQANMAMPLSKQLDRPSREIAQQIVERLDVNDVCETPELAGPGFINLRLRDSWLAAQMQKLEQDDRLGVPAAASPRTYVIDYSAPNVAKPMHVGHIRSTVIGAALDRTLRFLGHTVVSDNHIGDWGTQFGMIIYGYKHFRDLAAYEQNPVQELGRLYRLVNRMVDYHECVAAIPELRKQLTKQESVVAELSAAPPAADKNAAKQAAKALKKAEDNLDALRESLSGLHAKLAAIEGDPVTERIAREHPEIGQAVLQETARLHSGDAENLRIWHEALPACRQEIDRLYSRLNVSFDHTLGESFYHDRLGRVVEELSEKGIARRSDGALCVFFEGRDTPFVVQKQDGAFLYSTTDLATIEYRMETWRPDAILYVVDHRQSLHFEMLFDTARQLLSVPPSPGGDAISNPVRLPPPCGEGWGGGRPVDQLELQHVNFGTVLGDDGRPFKTRSGDTVGLESLLDEAVNRAHAIVSANDDANPNGAQLSDERRHQVAEAVGIGALKYADLSQNRTSDYVFSYDKMLAMNGNTATYMQYAYARVLSIFAKGGAAVADVRADKSPIEFTHPAERALAIAILQLPEALQTVIADYRPNHLTSYLFELANRYSSFFENCPVLKAETDALRISRLKLCDLTARTIKLGLHLLGIEVVEKM